MNAAPPTRRVPAPRVLVIADEALGRYGFPNGHSFGPDRLGAFLAEYRARGLADHCIDLPSRGRRRGRAAAVPHRALSGLRAGRGSADGTGALDEGDTPAFRGCYEAAARVVGATLDAAQALLAGHADRAFVPIAGLHHAARDKAAGFCIFNDIGVLIEVLRKRGLRRVAYVDIDAHHGDGVFYPFENDPFLVVADVHEDGQFLYPGTGRSEETGAADARGSKLNVPLPPGADDAAFAAAWPAVLAHLTRAAPEFIILQCGVGQPGWRSTGPSAAHTGAGACSPSAAAATTGPTLPPAGARWSRRCCKPDAPVSGTLGALFWLQVGWYMYSESMTIERLDPDLARALAGEKQRQEDHIELIASENYASPRVLAAQGSVLTNKYAEGYPGKRYYGGCEYVDIVEQLAIDRAKRLFGADFANVQPHSGSQATPPPIWR